MIWSVSTLARSSGTTRPFSTVNFSIVRSSCCRLGPSSNVDEVALDRRRRGHHRAYEMRTAARALASLEVAVGGRGATLSRRKTVRVHAEAHRAAGLAPFEARFAEDAIETFALGLLLDQARARYHQRELHVLGDTAALDHRGRGAQVLDARVGARTDE